MNKHYECIGTAIKTLEDNKLLVAGDFKTFVVNAADVIVLANGQVMKPTVDVFCVTDDGLNGGV